MWLRINHPAFLLFTQSSPKFIDATKSGGIGRFANHSCMPNCYVAKWTIGNFVRMGIFAKRDIQKHEELTFNYNVDRYGYAAILTELSHDEPALVNAVTKHRLVTVASPTVWATLAVERRQTLQPWMICILTVCLLSFLCICEIQCHSFQHSELLMRQI